MGNYIPAQFRGLLRYLLFSVCAAAVDSAAVWAMLSFFRLNIVLSNTVGVVLGFLLHYLLSSRAVFHTRYSLKGFMIFLLTFIIGLTAANFIIWSVYSLSEPAFGHTRAFLLGKGLSIVIPFFIMFYMRRYLYNRMDGRRY